MLSRLGILMLFSSSHFSTRCPSLTLQNRSFAIWRQCRRRCAQSGQSRVLKTKHAQWGFRNTFVANLFPRQHPASTENVTSRYVETPFRQLDSLLVQCGIRGRVAVKFRIETSTRHLTCSRDPCSFANTWLADEYTSLGCAVKSSKISMIFPSKSSPDSGYTSCVGKSNASFFSSCALCCPSCSSEVGGRLCFTCHRGGSCGSPIGSSWASLLGSGAGAGSSAVLPPEHASMTRQRHPPTQAFLTPPAGQRNISQCVTRGDHWPI